jgi:DNA-binding HxlR family transcriptional regulator
MATFKMNDKRFSCPVQLTLHTIMGKWKALILWHLRTGTKRYSELKRELPEISDKMLAQQLRELESDQIIIRTVFPEVPPRVEYKLSERGEAIQPILKLMQQWGIQFKE